jgi:hypothetical protein
MKKGDAEPSAITNVSEGRYWRYYSTNNYCDHYKNVSSNFTNGIFHHIL